MYLLNRAPDRGVTYEIVCVVSSEDTFAEEVRVERRGIPTRAHPIQRFYAARSPLPVHRLGTRAAYDAETLELLDPYMPDLVLLDGYLYLVTDPLLNAYPARIISLHFSDLMIRRADGSPRFPGVRAVRDALSAGCAETRATVHLVDEAPDNGPPIVRSWPFPVSLLVEELRTQHLPDVFKAYAYAHQQWMLRTVSGPLVAAALRLIATGAVDLTELAAAGAGRSAPWLLDQDGSLLAPERECVRA